MVGGSVEALDIAGAVYTEDRAPLWSEVVGLGAKNMATSHGAIQMESLADRAELLNQVGPLRWREWDHGDPDATSGETEAHERRLAGLAGDRAFGYRASGRPTSGSRRVRPARSEWTGRRSRRYLQH